LPRLARLDVPRNGGTTTADWAGSEPSAVAAPLDPGFQPAALFNRHYVAAAKRTCRAVPLVLGLEREGGLISRYETVVMPGNDLVTARYVERLVKYLLWSRGGWHLHVGGPKAAGQLIRRVYAPRGTRAFDWEMMSTAYGKRFRVESTSPERVPAARERQFAAGGHRRGYRLGFALDSYEYSVSAVAQGTPVFTETSSWEPRSQSNPAYHYHHIAAALHRAAAHLPRVDAIGVSTSGITVDGRLCVTSLFRAVPKRLQPQAADMFRRLQQEWAVPFMVMNDGDVAALAGRLALGCKGVLSVAMGAAEAAGYTDSQGRLPGWLNELAIVPVDYNPAAPADEWSGDRGMGVMYFSRQAVSRLMPLAGIRVPGRKDLLERLKVVGDLLGQGDARAAQIYETIGVYLGYALAQAADFYDFRDALLQGDILEGNAGTIVAAQARAVLRSEFPDLHARIRVRLPDGKRRRIPLSVAAASLPSLRS
jgi:predicted NBD/HSP70 family sugar kinase